MSTQLRLPMAAEKGPGVIYTKPWVVELILDFLGYRGGADLASLIAVEPAAGEGAFLIPMVRRLVASLQGHGRSLDDASRSIAAYEIDEESVHLGRQLVVEELVGQGYNCRQASRIAKRWVIRGDYLLSARYAPRADIVVGNPPYVRYDDMVPGTFEMYRAVCPTMVGRCDIYIGFIETALRQLKRGGRLGFICADRWMRAAYGSELRRFVAANASIEVAIEMHDAHAFQDRVAAYPAVIVIRRGVQGRALVASAGSESGPLDKASLADAIVDLAENRRATLAGFRAARLESWYSGEMPWPWAEPAALELLQHLEARFQPLEDTRTGTRVGIGVATGADGVFVTTESQLVETDRLLPLAMAHDGCDGLVRWSGHYLVDPWGPDDEILDLRRFPKLASYYNKHANTLKRRNIAVRHEAGWYRTIDRVAHSLLAREKLYLADMKLEATPFLDRGKTYPHHNLYYVVSDEWDMEVLGGLLLSKVAELFVASYCVKMRGGTLRFQAQFLRRIRVPEPHTLSPSITARLRAAFRAYDRDAATAAALDAYGIKELAMGGLGSYGMPRRSRAVRGPRTQAAAHPGSQHRRALCPSPHSL